ncbi:MAG TPA: hypothetical protein VI636_14300 [Candidatus Angelobacter sp.]
MRKLFSFGAVLFLLWTVFPAQGKAQSATQRQNLDKKLLNCDSDLGFCRERVIHTGGTEKYIGHDEPAINFYSNVPGSGNSAVYLLTLPLDPPTLPVQDGGGTFNFQLHPTFWFGMNLCDTQSYPEFTNTCNPDTDDNIFDSIDPNSPQFIGKHPGTAFMELQFYPPGWVATPGLTEPQNYFVAMNIFSLNVSGATGIPNNASCFNTFGSEEPGNFAIVTRNGVPLSPPNPLGSNFGKNNFDLTNVLFMAPGDQVLIVLHDTAHGLEAIVLDLNNGKFGSMVASAANGFGQVLFQPNSATCNLAPYDFHAMYATSNEHTRTPWSGGTDNTTFSDELGHFEFCDAADPNTLNCLVPGIQDRKTGLDADDTVCVSPGEPLLPGPPFIQVGGCVQTEFDFDGVSYNNNWPGTLANVRTDRQLHPQPIRFTSPLFLDQYGLLRNFDRVAFETDIPGFDPNCNQVSGAGCSVPAKGMAFYPFFTTSINSTDGVCRWQFGGGLIPGTANNFGGNPASAWGNLFPTAFQTGPNSAANFFTDFRRAFDANPCGVSVDWAQGSVQQMLHH